MAKAVQKHLNAAAEAMIRVYIAMPYGDDNDCRLRQYRTERAMAVWHTLASSGFQPFCPLLSHFLHEFQPQSRDFWLAQVVPWVDQCDCVLALGDSEGIRMEIQRANQNKSPVFRMISALADAYGMEIV